MKDILESAVRLIAILSFSVLWLAFSYEYGFFSVVGRPLQSLMSASDYMSTAVLWLPYTVLAVGAGLLLFFSMERASGFTPTSEIRKRYKTPRRAWLAQDLPFFAVGVITIGFLVYQLTFGNLFENKGPSQVGFILVWIWFCGWMWKAEKLLPYFTSSRSAAAVAVPCLTVLAYWDGAIAGTHALTQIDNVYVVKTETDANEHNFQLLRILSNGVLLRDPINERIVYNKWDDITEFAMRAPAPQTTPLVCKVFGFWCPATPTTP